MHSGFATSRPDVRAVFSFSGAMSKPKLTNEDYCRASKRLRCDVAAVKAVASVESASNGFYDDGFPVILFERHLFKKHTGGRFTAKYPAISGPAGNYGAAGQHQRNKFNLAFSLDSEAAMKACSWGKFQILGENHHVCGYSTVGAFVDAMKAGEPQQLDAFVSFVIGNHLAEHLRNRDWKAFARGYNGAGYRKNAYDTKLATAYARFSKENIDCSNSSTVKPPGKTADSNDQSAENTDELNSPSMPTAADSPERPKRMSADEQIMPDQSDQEGLTSGSSQEQPPLPAPVLAVPALSPGQTEEKTDTPAQEGTLTKIGNKLNAAYTAVGATIAGMIAWFSSVPGEVVMWIVIGVIALGISYMIINAIRAGIQDMADRRDKRLAADREFELKKMREAHVQEAQMYSMRSVAEKDLTPVTILSPPPTVEMPNSDNQGAS